MACYRKRGVIRKTPTAVGSPDLGGLKLIHVSSCNLLSHATVRGPVVGCVAAFRDVNNFKISFASSRSSPPFVLVQTHPAAQPAGSRSPSPTLPLLPLMLSTRPLHVLRPSLLPPLRASSSRIPLRTAQSDRYLLIRDFFTRQSSLTYSPPPLPLSFRPRSPLIPRRWNSTTPSSSPSSGKTPNERPKDCPHCGPTPSNIPATPPPPTIGPAPGHAQDYTPFIRRLIQQSQLLKANAPHRPTKEQLLEAASSWWERLRIRIKWFTIRGWRRFNTDDLSAFASWFVLGNSEWRAVVMEVYPALTTPAALWILIGT